MKKVLILSSDQDFLSDLEGAILLWSGDDVDIEESNDFEGAENNAKDYDRIVFPISDVDYFADPHSIPNLAVFLHREEENADGFPSYGVCRTAGDLVQTVSETEPENLKEEMKPEPQDSSQTQEPLEKPQEEAQNTEEPEDDEDFGKDISLVDDEEDNFDDDEDYAPPRRRRREETPQNEETPKNKEEVPPRRREPMSEEEEIPRRRKPVSEGEEVPRRRRPTVEEEAPRRRRPAESEEPRRRRPSADGEERPRRRRPALGEEETPRRRRPVEEEPRRRKVSADGEERPRRRRPAPEGEERRKKPVEAEPRRRKPTSEGENPRRRRPIEEPPKAEEPVRHRRHVGKKDIKNSAKDALKGNPPRKHGELVERPKANRAPRKVSPERQVEEDLGIEKGPAKIITVYSAKGGVGKTTIACELATRLALTRNGKENFKVCLVDYNIDFGDVFQTLKFDQSGVTMSLWSELIAEDIDNGRPTTYEKEQIRTDFLQKKEQDGLYALLAPLYHEDSMAVREDTMPIMLQNLRDNGGFDYIVCDTGNNTRNSTYFALDIADIILMVLTQNVNTVGCNDSFLQMVGQLDFHTDKIGLVINKIRKENIDVTVDDVANQLTDPKTGRIFPCVAKIDFSLDVIRANNNGIPLTYQSNNKFSESIGEICSYITGHQTTPSAPKKKKGFFASLFHKS